MFSRTKKGRKSGLLRFFPRVFACDGFTLLELLVAMALLAILVVLLLGIVDNGAKLWRTSENRVDSYREARAALGVMSRDLQGVVAGTNTNYFRLNDTSYTPSGATMGTNASSLFFLTALPKTAQWSSSSNVNKSDICQVGYFVGYGQTAVSSNAPVRTLNLYRIFLGSDDAYARLGNTNQPAFPTDAALTDPRVDLLARNIVSFQVNAYQTNTAATSLTNFVPTPGLPLPAIVEVSIVTINQDTGKKLNTSAAAWSDTNAALIKANMQTFTARIRLNN